MTKQYGVKDEWDGLIDTFDTLEKAERYYDDHKRNRMAEGVNFEDTFVSIVESEDEFETEKVIKKVIAVYDEELTKEIGTPEENGYEWVSWAKWSEVVS